MIRWLGRVQMVLVVIQDGTSRWLERAGESGPTDIQSCPEELFACTVLMRDEMVLARQWL